MKKFPWWPYVRIELEICGIVAESRYVQNKDYQRILNLFIAYGKTQPYDWAVFVKRHICNKSLKQRKNRAKLKTLKNENERH